MKNDVHTAEILILSALSRNDWYIMEWLGKIFSGIKMGYDDWIVH